MRSGNVYMKEAVEEYFDRRYTIAEVTRSPNAVFRKIKKSLG